MTYEEAIKILHPDTTFMALSEVEYFGGFNGEEAKIKAVEEACVIACEALKKQIPQKPNLKREQTSPFGVDDVPYCPTCNCSVPWIETSVFYCENCGQAID